MSRYQADPNNPKKQIPKTIVGQGYYGKVTTPAAEVITAKPNHILVNMNGTYAFAYESGSVGTYITGSVVDDGAGPIRLDISPVAWRQTNAAGSVGDVTFVYKGNEG